VTNPSALSRRLAFVLAAVIFLVLAGGGSAAALWMSRGTVVSTVQAASLSANCTAPVGLANGGFENAAGTPVWTTTDPAGIELWASGHFDVPSAVGAQFIELNGSRAATISQTITTAPGQTLQWSFYHRGRAGTDTVQVLIGGSVATGVSQGSYTTGSDAWKRYTATYVVPTGQATTTFALRATGQATADASVGNFVDAISFGTGPCLTATSTVTNLNGTSSSAVVGDVLSYTTTVTNSGGAAAVGVSVSTVLPTGLVLQAGSLKVDGVAKTDAGADDAAERTTTAGVVPAAFTARLATGSTTAVGGTLQGKSATTFGFSATITSAAATGSIAYAPVIDYTDALAPGWPITARATTLTTSFAGGIDVTVLATVTPTPTSGSSTGSTWSFSVSNTGAAAAGSVTVMVSWPTTLTVSAVTLGGVACTMSGSAQRTCTLASLAVGVSRALSVTGTTSAAQGATIAVTATATTAGDYDSADNSATNTATVLDTLPPSAITTLAASATTSTQTTLAWSASTDNVGVVGYAVYRGNGTTSLVGEVTSTGLVVTGLVPGTTNSFTVRARDAAGNTSAASNQVVVITPMAVLSPTASYRIGYGTLCLDAKDAGTTSGTQVVINTCATAAKQRWNFTPSSDGYYYVKPSYSTLLGWDVDVTSGNGSNNGQKVSLRGGTATNQQWMPVAVEGADGVVTVKFVARSSAKCLDINGQGNTLLTQVQQWDCNATIAQVFVLTAAP
jgi:uncharacterized repeat protein (TIGR01451 family)